MASPSPSSTLHIYTRVSTVAQADRGTSLDSQLELGRKKAIDLGFSYQHWDEGGKSSHHEDIADRPVLSSLYAAIRSGQVKHLWVYDQSRLSRNDQVASIFRYECNKQGVTLYTKDGQFDLSSAQDKFLKQLLDAVAEFDNSTRAERSRLGKVQRVRSGFWHGGPPPYGYCTQSRRLAVEPTEATWVRRMFELSAAGSSPAAIRKELDANGVTARRGGLWSLGSIAALLRNTHYTGQYDYKDHKSGEVYPVVCPPIVDIAIWETVQRLHRRDGNRHNQANATKKFYLLRDLMYCTHCGRPLSARKGKLERDAVYYCPNKEREWVAKGGKSDTPWVRGAGCGFERAMNLPRTDELIWRLVQDMHAKSSLLKEEVKQQVLSQQGIAGYGDQNQRQRAESKARRLQKELSAVVEAIANLSANHLLQQVDDHVYALTRKKLEEQRDRTSSALEEVKAELAASLQKKKWVDWLDNFGNEIGATNTFSDEQRKGYIEGIVERIDVSWVAAQRSHELTVHFRLPIVGDRIQWRDVNKKSLGYEVVEGSRQTTASLFKKDLRG